MQNGIQQSASPGQRNYVDGSYFVDGCSALNPVQQ